VNTRVTLIQDVPDKRQDKAAGAEFYFRDLQPFDDEGKAVFSVEMLDMQFFIEAFDEREDILAMTARRDRRNDVQKFFFIFPETSGAVEGADDGGGGVMRIG
jgi:hypothetical protein